MTRGFRRLIAGGAFAAMSISIASAADMPMKAAPAIVPPPPNWTGFYIGANLGGVWTRNDATWTPLPAPATFGANLITGSLNGSGVAGGVHGGYNWQLGPSFVLGIEGDWSWTNTSASFTQVWTLFGTTTPVVNSFTTMSSKLDALASIRGRAGYLVTPNLLAYVTGGAAWGRIGYAANNSNGVGGVFGYTTAVAFTNTKSGYTVGGGLEWKLAGNWLVRGEYLYYRFNGASAVGTSPVAPLNPSGYAWSDMQVHEARGGISYQF